MIYVSKILIMLRLQGEMNAIVNPSWKDAGYNWMRAILVETVEGMEHHSWKWWKKQEIDYPQLRMELVDIWHFLLSHMLVEAHKRAVCVPGVGDEESIARTICHPASISAENFDIPYNGSWYDANQPLIDDLQLMAGMAAFNDYSLQLFSNIMNKAGLSWDDLAGAYLSKNVLNQFRQRNGYKDGTYVKDWSTVKLTHVCVTDRSLEDNDHLHDIMQVIDPSCEQYVDLLMANLQSRYQAVLAAK